MGSFRPDPSVLKKHPNTITQQQIDYAKKAYDLSNERLKENQRGSSASEVLLSMQSVSMAQLNYVTALRSYDRAQLRRVPARDFADQRRIEHC